MTTKAPILVNRSRARFLWERVSERFWSAALRRTSAGRDFDFYVRPGDLIGNLTIANGLFERYEIQALQYLIQLGRSKDPRSKPGIFLDIGANIGAYSVALSSQFAEVIAFEPNPIVANILRANLAQNRCRNVKVVEQALGAEPVTINVNQIYAGLKDGKVDAQENPLAVTEVFKLYEVQKHMAMTNHMWSGFNLMANLALWRKLPADIQAVIERNASKYVRLQREDQGAFNGGLRKTLTERGMVFNDVDQELFRARMAPVYAVWKEKLGAKCWSLLEGHVGKLG